MDEKTIVVSAVLAMVIFELVPMLKNGEKRLVSVYAVFLTVAAALFFIFDSGVEILSVGEILGNIMG